MGKNTTIIDQTQQEQEKKQYTDEGMFKYLNDALKNGDFEEFWKYLKGLFGTKSQDEIDGIKTNVTNKIGESFEEKEGGENIKKKEELIGITNSYAEDAKGNIEVEKIEKEIEEIKKGNGINLNDPNTMKIHEEVTEVVFKELYESKIKGQVIENKDILNIVKGQNKGYYKDGSLEFQYLTAVQEQEKLDAEVKKLTELNTKANEIVTETQSLATTAETLSNEIKTKKEELEKAQKKIEEAQREVENKNTAFEDIKSKNNDTRKENKIKADFFDTLKNNEININGNGASKYIKTSEEYEALTVEKKKKFIEKYKESIDNYDNNQGAQLNVAFLKKLVADAELEEAKANRDTIQNELNGQKAELVEKQQEIQSKTEELYKLDLDYGKEYEDLVKKKKELEEGIKGRVEDVENAEKYKNDNSKIKDNIKQELLNHEVDDDKLKEMFDIKDDDDNNKLTALKGSLFKGGGEGVKTVSLDNLNSEELENLMKYQEQQSKKEDITLEEKAKAQTIAAYLKQVAIPNKKVQEELEEINKQIEEKREEISKDPQKIAENALKAKREALEAKNKEVEEKGNEIVNKVSAHMDIEIKREQQMDKLKTQARPVPSGEDYIRKMAEIDAIKNGASLEEARKAAQQIQVGEKGPFNSAQNKAIENAKKTINNQQIKIQKCQNDMKAIEDKMTLEGGGLEKTIKNIKTSIDNKKGFFGGVKDKDKAEAKDLIDNFTVSLLEANADGNNPEKVLEVIKKFKEESNDKNQQSEYSKASPEVKKLFDEAIEKHLVSDIKLYKINKVVIGECEKISENQYKTIGQIVNKKVEKRKTKNLEEDIKGLQNKQVNFKNKTKEEIIKELKAKNEKIKQKKEELAILNKRFVDAKAIVKQKVNHIKTRTEQIEGSIKRKNYKVNEEGKVVWKKPWINKLNYDNIEQQNSHTAKIITQNKQNANNKSQISL